MESVAVEKSGEELRPAQGFLPMESVTVEKSAEELRREIDELTRQQREITERLRDPRGLRRGIAAGANVRPAIRSLGRGMPFRGALQRGDDFGSEDSQTPTKKRLLSTVVKVEDEQAEKLAQEKVDVEEAAKDKDIADPVNEQVNNRRPFLQRASSARRDNRKGMELDAPPAEPVPRVLLKEGDPNMAKRNRRMFGALLGTLEKFRQEDRQLSATEAFLRRSDSLKRAEQRAQEESERLREQEREQLAEKRRRDLTLRARLAAKAEEKQLELLFIQWTDHHNNLCKFLRTKAEPSIFYIPGKTPENIEKILEEQQKDLLEWKSKRREELTEYQKQLREEYLANVEAEIERWQAGSNRKNSLNASQENIDAEEGGNESFQESRRLKPRISREDDADEEVEDMGDDDIEDIVLEDEEAARNDQAHEEDLKGVVEYASGEE